MIGMRLREAKGRFLDADKVAKRMDRATIRALAKFGAFVRRRAKSSIRKRKGASQPGSPPSSHTGLLRDNILFVVEPTEKNVVIGPILINKPIPGIVETLEHGGETMILAKGKEQKTLIPATIEPRPFMQPAFDEELSRAPYLWENGIAA